MATTSYASSTERLPADVRWMNLTAALLAGGVLVAFASMGVLKLLRNPAFSLRAIAIEGDVERSSEAAIRASALPKLKGTFFTLRLGAAQEAFESLPWVRKAVVSRVWPWRLKVRLEEHKAAAIWAPDENTEELVNTFGEVFEASVGDLENGSLPVFSGAAANSGQILQMYRTLAPVFGRIDAQIVSLALSGRGSWKVGLNKGAQIELGRGSDQDVLKRTEQFLTTLPWVAKQDKPDIESADLRHREGYALRLRQSTATSTP